MWRNRLAYYGGLIIVVTMLNACSAIEYVGQKKSYTVTAPHISLKTDAEKLSAKAEKVIAPESSLYTKNRLSLLSISKTSSGSSKNLGSIYFKNSLISNSNSDLVFQLTYDRSGYKATTPLFFSNEKMASGLVFTLNRKRHFIIGIECTIKLNPFW
jgi:hypothetical protein